MYPKWKYHTTEKPRIFYNAQEEAAAGDDWQESPASFFKKVKAKIERCIEKIEEVIEDKPESAEVKSTEIPSAETPVVISENVLVNKK